MGYSPKSERLGFSLHAARYTLAAVLIAGCAFFRQPVDRSAGYWEQVRQQIHLKGPSALSVGVAKVEITPPVGTPLAGYSKRQGKPSQGIRDPLYTRALAIDDGEDVVVLVSTDLLVFPAPMAEALVDEISQEFKLPRQAIVLSATHTHSGAGAIAPGFFHEMVFGSYRPQVKEGISARVVWAVRQALAHRQPVRWATAKGSLQGLTENRADPLGMVDPALTVFFFESQEGMPQAILVHTAAHPTLMDSKDFRFSADYPGEVVRLLESSYPGAVALFFNGPAGDVRPKDLVGSNPEERIRHFGSALAEGAVGLINQMSIRLKADLAAWGFPRPLPRPQMYLGRIPIHPALGRLMRSTSTYLNLVAIDRQLLVPLPAELTAELGIQLKEKLASRGLEGVLLGYSGGYLGYAVTPTQYRNRSYEAWMTWYGAGFGEFLLQEIQRLAYLYPEEQS